MQTPEGLLRRANAARPKARSGTREAEVAVRPPDRRLVMNPVKVKGVYRSLMESHDRMGTRHLG